MPDAGEALGQDVQQPAPDEFVRMKRHDAGFARVAVGPAQEHVAMGVISDEAFGGEGAAPDVAGEVAQGGAAAAGVLDLDVPGFGGREDVALGGSEFLIEFGVMVFEMAVDEAAEAPGQRAVMDEEVVLGGAVEAEMFGMEGGCGNDEMNVRMMLDLTAPGVQHAGEAEPGAAVFGGADVLKGGRALGKQERVEDFRMEQAERAQFGRQGEGDHEVGHGQQPGLLFGRPDLLVERAAARAAAVVAAVVGMVAGFASATLVETAAQLGRAAREDAPHGPVMVGVERVSAGIDITLPMPAEQVGKVQGHGRRRGRGVDLTVGEGFERLAALAFADLGEMEVAHDFLERAVAEIGGDLADRRAAFEHVGAEAVAQGMGGDVLVFFGESGFGGGQADGVPHGGAVHGVGTAAHVLAQGDAGVVDPPADAGEEPFGVLVIGVEPAQAGEQSGGDGDFARLAVLGLGNMDDKPLAVDVAGLDGQGLAEAQPALVNDGEEGAEASVAEGAQELGDLATGQHVGQRFVAADVDLLPDVPVEPEVVTVERAQPADGLVDGGRREFALVLEVDEEIEHPSRRHRGQVGLLEVLAKLADPGVVVDAAALGKAF